MRIGIMAVTGVLLLAGGPLRAQEVPGTEAAADSSASVPTVPRPPALPRALPRALAPDDAPARSPVVVRDDGANDGPFIGAMLGAVAGLLVARVIVANGCRENCSEDLLLTGFVGVMMGGALGWRLGGGDIDDPPPWGRR
jgi:hypothetical protein